LLRKKGELTALFTISYVTCGSASGCAEQLHAGFIIQNAPLMHNIVTKTAKEKFSFAASLPISLFPFYYIQRFIVNEIADSVWLV
jgi:hypothetical protein